MNGLISGKKQEIQAQRGLSLNSLRGQRGLSNGIGRELYSRTGLPNRRAQRDLTYRRPRVVRAHAPKAPVEAPTIDILQPQRRSKGPKMYGNLSLDSFGIGQGYGGFNLGTQQGFSLGDT